MDQVPAWASPPGPDWSVRSASDIDVVWEHGAHVQVQHAPHRHVLPDPVRDAPRTVFLRGSALVGSGVVGGVLVAVVGKLLHLL